MADLKSIIMKAQAGNLDAFGKIVRQFQDMAVGYAYSILGDFQLAEDAAQEAFIAAHRDLRTLRTPDAFPAWFRKIIYKYCDRFRRRQRVETLPLEAAIDMPSHEPSPVEIIEKQELKENVLDAIHELPENQRVVTTLFYINGYPQREIADFLDISVAAVKKRLQYSRKRLKERMMDMVRESLQQNRPSKDEQFANRVQLFTAVEAGQLEQVKAILDKDATQVNAQNENSQTPLHRAAYRGHKPVVELLINKGADVNAKDEKGQTPLHQLAIVSTMTDIAELLINAGADVNAKDKYDNTPLFLSHSCDVHKLRGSGYSPLDFWELLEKSGAETDVFTAALSVGDKLEKLLQENSTRANARRGQYNWTPLHYVADLGFPGSDKILLKYGADVNVQDTKGRTPLQLATHRLATEIEYFFGGGWSQVIPTLLEHGAGEDIFDNAALGRWERIYKLFKEDRTLRTARNAGGNTPLHIAAWNGQRDAVQFFMATIEDLNPKNKAGKTPIQLTAEDGHKSVAEMLLRRGVECDIFTAATLGIVREVRSKLQEEPQLANATDDDGRSVLLSVSARWRKEKCFWREWRYEQKEEALLKVIELLLESGAEMDIWTAASLGREDDVAALIESDSTLINEFEDDLAPIHCAALMGYPDVIELLLDNSASLEARGQWTGTPLHLAAWAGQREAAETLLNRGADIETKTAQGMTPLQITAYENQIAVAELLVERGANVNTGEGEPLLSAVWHNNLEFVEMLIRAGADVNRRPRGWGASALYFAASDSPVELVACLLEHGANVNEPDDDKGKTPLHAAVESDREKNVKLLISHGADLNAKTNGEIHRCNRHWRRDRKR